MTAIYIQPRQVIQTSMAPAGIVALCDDGTMWFKPNGLFGSDWEPLSPPPSPAPAPSPLPEGAGASDFAARLRSLSADHALGGSLIQANFLSEAATRIEELERALAERTQ